MAGQESYPQTVRQIEWFTTIGSRIRPDASRLSASHAVIPRGEEGEVVRGFYVDHELFFARLQREKDRILRGPETSLMEFFDYRDYAKGASAELGERYGEAGIPYTDFSYFGGNPRLSLVGHVHQAIGTIRERF